MVSIKNKKPLENCKIDVETKINQYYITVHLTLGIKYYVENNECGCNFIASERTMKDYDTNKELHPDLIFQYDNNTKGIIGEIKSSISFGNENIEKIIKQIKSYDTNLVGWDTEDQLIQEHDIISFVHSIDSDKFVELIENLTNFDLTRSYCITEFSSPQKSPKYGEGDIILIKHRFGKINCTSLSSILMENIRIPIDKLSNLFDKCKFVRTPPPIQYTMNQLWMLIFSSFASRDPSQHEIIVTLDQIEKVTTTYFSSWSGIQGQKSQIKTSWIKKAMEKFEEINLLEILDEDPLKYRIFIKKGGLKKNIREYIIEETCKKDIELYKNEINNKTQTKIIDFDKPKLQI